MLIGGAQSFLCAVSVYLMYLPMCFDLLKIKTHRKIRYRVSVAIRTTLMWLHFVINRLLGGAQSFCGVWCILYISTLSA